MKFEYKGHLVRITKVSVEIAPRLIETAWDYTLDGRVSDEVFDSWISAEQEAKKLVDQMELL